MNDASTKTAVLEIPTLNVVGENQFVPLANGMQTRYINLDNAASTPCLQAVIDYLNRFIPYYSSVHRGSGFKSQASTELYDQAHEIVGRFVGANLEQNTVIFTKNATEALNKLSYRLPFKSDSVVLTTEMEHHSNDLPWRDKAKTEHIKVTDTGVLDIDDLETKLKHHNGNVALVCVSGASNVTGLVQPIHSIAKIAHYYHAKILVDAAQLAPHRKVDIRSDSDISHIDYLVFSAHKIYAPFGTGVLIAPKELFLHSAPEYSGGGTVDAVTLDSIRWAGLPDREEAGSPNVIGAIALAKAIVELEKIGMDAISNHEMELTKYTLQELQKIDGLQIYGNTEVDRVGVITFSLGNEPHAKIASILSSEYGIAVRNGCFCAHPYVVRLLNLCERDVKKWQSELEAGNKTHMPGLVRISFGCYNTKEDVDLFLMAIHKISRSESKLQYKVDTKNGDYAPYMSINPSVHSILETKNLNY